MFWDPWLDYSEETIQYRAPNNQTQKQFHDNLSARDFQYTMNSENYDWAVSELDRVIFEGYSDACPIPSLLKL